MAGIDLTSKSVPIGFNTFTGGLNSTANPLALKDGELSDVQNVDYNKFGSVLKRSGYSALNTSAFNSGATFTSLHFLEQQSGTDFIVGTCGDKIAKQDAFDGTWDDITGGLTITAGNDNKFHWVNFGDNMYGTNGVDVPIKWTGSGNAATWTTVTDLTKAKYTETWQNYLFLAHVVIDSVTHSTRLYWSCINEPETWSTLDFNEIGFKDGDEITGIKALGDRLVIFKQHSIWLAFFTGSSDIPFVFQKSQSDVGTVSSHSIQKVNNGLIFLSDDGLYFFDGNNSTKLSDKLNNTFSTVIKKSRMMQTVSGYQQTKNRYWLAFTEASGNTNDRILTFDTFNNAFSIYKGHNANAITVLLTSGAEKLYFGDYLGFTYEADTGTNDFPSNSSTAIDSFFKTKWFSYGDLLNKKGIPQCVIYYQCGSATLSFSYTYDLQEGDDFSQSFSIACPGATWDSGVWDTDSWGRDGGNITRRDLTGRGYLVRFKFSNSTASETFQIHGLGQRVHLETYQ